MTTNQKSAVREGGDIDLGMLDQEASAPVLASGQQQQQNQTPSLDQQHKGAEEDEEDEEHVTAEDVAYRPSAVGLEDNADPIWRLRLACLPILDILVLASCYIRVFNDNRVPNYWESCLHINIRRFFKL